MKKRIRIFLKNKYFEKFIIILILLNVFVFIFETDKTFYSIFAGFIKDFEVFSVAVFSIEYLMRVLTLKRFKNILKPLMIVDLLAILPFYLSFATINTTVLRILRLVRLFRIAKLTRYTRAVSNIKKALILKRQELILTGAALLTCMVIFSILIYYAENDSGQVTFSSIPASFWWAVVTFTSVGYGDAYPTTTIGKIIASFAALFGLCFNGLFIGIIASAFTEAMQHKKAIKEKQKEKRKERLYEKINC